MKLSFLGGASTVTVSKTLLESASGDQILVDCGLFQGLKNLRLKNRADLEFDPKKLTAILLTHAHLDHSGYIPLIVKKGFKGPIYCTKATYELCKILLADSGYLQEEEAKYANLKGFTKHHPAEPLYTQEDAKNSLKYFKVIKDHKVFDIAPNINACFYNAGHILGSSFIKITIDHKTVIFSGDLGRPHDLVMNPPDPLPKCDYLILESTYGDREHPKTDAITEIKAIVQQAIDKKSVVIVPAFAVGRAQTLLYVFSEIKKDPAFKNIPVYLNSPMATKVTELYCENSKEHKLSAEQCEAVFGSANYVQSVEESIALNSKNGPMIIISASGMATGGRVLHHLKQFMPDPNNFILFSGYQAPGTRGETIVSGKDKVKIHGQYHSVKSQVIQLDTLSAHADANEMIEWLKTTKAKPQNIFINHGEAKASDELRKQIKEQLEWDAYIPLLGETKEL